MATFTIKRGGTLLLALLLSDTSGNPIDLTGVTIAAQLRDAGSSLVEQLTITPAADVGAAVIEATDTATWPIGRLLCDIKVSFGGIVLVTDTFAVRVIQEVTQ
jgi:hypothetical protein